MNANLRITPYGNLKEGDEFIRVASHPVLLQDVDGQRQGARFTFPLPGSNKTLTVDIHRMVTTPTGFLYEVLAQ